MMRRTKQDWRVLRSFFFFWHAKSRLHDDMMIPMIGRRRKKWGICVKNEKVQTEKSRIPFLSKLNKRRSFTSFYMSN